MTARRCSRFSMRFSAPGVDGLRVRCAAAAGADDDGSGWADDFIACFDGDAIVSASFGARGRSFASLAVSVLPPKSSGTQFLFPMAPRASSSRVGAPVMMRRRFREVSSQCHFSRFFVQPTENFGRTLGRANDDTQRERGCVTCRG